MSNAGGAALHAGADYQQRISALLLICMYSRFDLSQLLGYGSPLTPATVSYETSSAVDDINVKCREGTDVLIQAKRSLSLSSLPQSEFVGVINQFVSSFVSSPEARHIYLLIASTRSSHRITRDLKKILDSIRYNDAAFRDNPLSQQELGVLTAYKQSFETCYKIYSRNDPSEETFIAFSKKAMVQSWDVESGTSLEKVAILLLHSLRFAIPQLIWPYLIAQSLQYASQRMSVDQNGIIHTLERYKMGDMSPNEMEPLINELLAPCLIDVEKIPVGKEVLLVSSFTNDAVQVLVECFRFDDAGQKRALINGSEAMLAEGDIRVPIIQRFASKEAFTRFCELRPDLIEGKKLVLMETDGMAGVEDSSAARAHRNFCIKLLRENKQLAKCLHSGRSCLGGTAYLVELDSPSLPPAVGLVRAEELRPLDRILGISYHQENTEKKIPNFDLGTWLAAIVKGQGLLRGIQQIQGVSNKHIVVGWNDANPNESSYSYCVKLTLEDGGFKYCYVRGKVERLPKYEAEARCQYFNETIIKTKDSDNPWCMTSENWSVGTRSMLESIRGADESILKVLSAEVCKYSDILGRTYNRNDSYYAPLCVVRNPSTDRILNFGNAVPLVSDPFALDHLLQNWSTAGIDAGSVMLSILKNDYEFDDFMREVFRDNLTPVIDPMLAPDGTPTGGIVIETFEQLEKRAKKAQQ